VRVKFTRAYKVKAVDGETYEEGQVVDLPDASAHHFIRRRAAVEVREAEPKTGRGGRGRGSTQSTDAGDAGNQTNSDAG
jgi:hypothetical protein